MFIRSNVFPNFTFLLIMVIELSTRHFLLFFGCSSLDSRKCTVISRRIFDDSYPGVPAACDIDPVSLLMRLSFLTCVDSILC